MVPFSKELNQQNDLKLGYNGDAGRFLYYKVGPPPVVSYRGYNPSYPFIRPFIGV